MIDVHSFALPGFVSQATFALTLTLLAWSDRRTRGTRWLAGACALQLGVTAIRAVLPLPSPAAENVGACLLVLVFFLVYLGLRWFVLRRRLATMNGPLALSAAMTAILSAGAVRQEAALAASRLVSIVVLAFTVEMLLRPRMRALRGAARATAFMIGGVMAVLTLRVLLGLEFFSSHYPGLDAFGHDATMVTVTALGFSFVGMYVAETKRRLHEETRLDSLTGLHNRRAFEEMAHREVLIAARESTPLTLLMMDLDHFKQLNDTWGHALGDRALRAFGGVLLTVTGSSDAVARLGGEEFAILLPGRSARSAMALAERLRATVEGLRLSEGEELVRFTVSVGLSSLRAGEQSLEQMCHRADRALYQAKREGRNRVVLADSLPGPVPTARPTAPATVQDLHPAVAMMSNGTTHSWPSEYARSRRSL